MARKSRRTDSHRVVLQSGGTVEVSFSGSVFDLSEDDREFVNFLVDAMRDYERAHSSPQAKRKAKAAAAPEGVESVAADA